MPTDRFTGDGARMTKDFPELTGEARAEVIDYFTRYMNGLDPPARVVLKITFVSGTVFEMQTPKMEKWKEIRRGK